MACELTPFLLVYSIFELAVCVYLFKVVWGEVLTARPVPAQAHEAGEESAPQRPGKPMLRQSRALHKSQVLIHDFGVFVSGPGFDILQDFVQFGF